MNAALMDDKENVTIITGASRGIGAAIAARLMAAGGRVVNVSDQAPDTKTGMATHLCDLTDADQTGAVVGALAQRYRVSGYVHCAGAPHMAPIDEFDLDAFRRLADLHLRSAMHVISLLTPEMKRCRRGHIVLIGSRVSLGRVNSSLYGALKSAVQGLVRALAVELAPWGVNVNAVSPGPVDTAMLRVYHPEGSPRRQALEASIPMGRIATTEDVSNAVEFFLKDESAYITGQNLFLCGGLDIAAAAKD